MFTSSLVYEVINKVLKASLNWIGGPCSSFAILPDFDFPDFWLTFRFIIFRLSLSLTRINGIIFVEWKLISNQFLQIPIGTKYNSRLENRASIFEPQIDVGGVLRLFIKHYLSRIIHQWWIITQTLLKDANLHRQRFSRWKLSCKRLRVSWLIPDWSMMRRFEDI